MHFKHVLFQLKLKELTKPKLGSTSVFITYFPLNDPNNNTNLFDQTNNKNHNYYSEDLFIYIYC